MIYSNDFIDVCEGEHRWSKDEHRTIQSIGEIIIIRCLNCLSLKIIQKAEQYNGKKCIGIKVSTTIVEPKEDSIFEEYH